MFKKSFSKSSRPPKRPDRPAQLKSSAPTGTIKKVGKYAYDASYDRFADYVPRTPSTDSDSRGGFSDRGPSRSSAPRSGGYSDRPSYGSASVRPARAPYGSRTGGSSARPAYGASAGSSSYGSRPSYGSAPSYGASAPAYGDRAPRTPSYGRGGSSSSSAYGDRGGSSYGGGRGYSSGGRGGFSGGRSSGGFSGGRSGGYASSSNSNYRRGPQGKLMDISKFINKAVVTEQTEVYVPDHAFADFEVEENLKANVIEKGYVTPSPIQDKSIPHILKGHDVVGIANTGTGKTAAFLIPLIDKVLKNPKQQVLIMAPTRELAIQIDQEFQIFAKGLKLFSVCCVGGEYIGKQLRELKYYNNFIIGTPGRLKDLIERGRINLATFNSVVLDEADRMLDMGFINDMRYIMNLMPKPRHTLFFSATLSPEIEKLIHEFLNVPVRISVKTRDTSKSVDQDVVHTRGKDKMEVLHDLLMKSEFSKVLIFGRTKHGVEKISVALAKMGVKVESIHGDKNHASRQRALRNFKENSIQALIATDVAARGLDIPNVTHVINFELPGSYEDYVHRIGRTGRAGKTGSALTFVD